MNEAVGADEIPPGLRAMLVAIRAALLMAADAITEFWGLEIGRGYPSYRASAAVSVIFTDIQPQTRTDRRPQL